MHRIVEGQKHNDVERRVKDQCCPDLRYLIRHHNSVKPKGVRLGYMGHLTLISEDVITAMQHYPPDLRLIIAQLAPQPDWDEYVNGRYNETKRRDSSLLGGGKPIVAPGSNRSALRWKIDEADSSTMVSAMRPENGGVSMNGMHEPLKGEFRRTGSGRPVRESSADFGPAPMEDDEDDHGTPRVRPRFLIHSTSHIYRCFLPVCSVSRTGDAVLKPLWIWV